VDVGVVEIVRDADAFQVPEFFDLLVLPLDVPLVLDFDLDLPRHIRADRLRGRGQRVHSRVPQLRALHELVERHLIDYARVTLPNVGGITEMLKIAALCETHSVGLVPHFTGPVSLAALVNVLCSQPIPVMMEIAGTQPQQPPHIAQGSDFRQGKLYPRDLPGLGVEFDPSGTDLVAEITEQRQPIPMYRRPDGSFTNW